MLESLIRFEHSLHTLRHGEVLNLRAELHDLILLSKGSSLQKFYKQLWEECQAHIKFLRSHY